LRDVAVVAGRRPVEEPQWPPPDPGAAAIDWPPCRGDAGFESRVEIFVEEVGRLHDVHVAIDKPISLFHPTLLHSLAFPRARFAAPYCMGSIELYRHRERICTRYTAGRGWSRLVCLSAGIRSGWEGRKE